MQTIQQIKLEPGEHATALYGTVDYGLSWTLLGFSDPQHADAIARLCDGKTIAQAKVIVRNPNERRHFSERD